MGVIKCLPGNAATHKNISLIQDIVELKLSDKFVQMSDFFYTTASKFEDRGSVKLLGLGLAQVHPNYILKTT